MKKLTKAQEESRQWAEKFLKEIFEPQLKAGKRPEVITVLKHVSASGMRREITLLTSHEGQLINLNQAACALMQDKCGKHDGIIVPGCGMDMGFHLVYNLGLSLWGFDRLKKLGIPPHSTRNNKPDFDGGYALRQRWA